MAQVNMIAAKRPYKGTAVGGTFQASTKNARVLAAIGRATYADAEPKPEKPVDKPAATKSVTKAPARAAVNKAVTKTTRTYTRRDLTAE